VVLTVLVGLSGGIVMASVAGASRTDSAMRRFVAYSRPEDVIVVVNGAGGDPSDPAVGARIVATRARVLALPQVAAGGRAPFVFLSADRAGTDVGGINPFAAGDPDTFRTLDRPRLLRGRLARPDHPDEAVVDDVTAAQRHLHLGSRVRLWAFSASQMGNPATTVFSKYPAPAGPSYVFRVVGVIRVPTGVDAPPASVIRDAVSGGVGAMYLTPAFLRQYAADQGVPDESLPGKEILRVRLRHGLTDLAAFERSVGRVVSRGDGQIHIGSDTEDAAAKTNRAIHLEVIALLVFAILAGLAAVLILGQALSRQVAADAADHLTLAALGMGRRDVVVVPLVRAGVIALGGGVVAVAVAVALSPLTPIGLARRAEINPGFAVNVAVLAIGFILLVIITLLRALLPAWRAARNVRQDAVATPVRPSRLRVAAAGSGLGPAAVAGMSMSLGRQRGIAFRAAQLAAVVAVTGVVAAATFGVSLGHLIDTPREQGWNWDVFVGNPNSEEALTGDPIAASLHQQMVRRRAGILGRRPVRHDG